MERSKLHAQMRKAIISKDPNQDMHGIEYHTYQLKQNKPYQVVIRGLQPTTSVEDIKAELLNIGHDGVNVTNVIIRNTEVKKNESGQNVRGKSYKVARPLFYVNLTPWKIIRQFTKCLTCCIPKSR